MSLGEGRTLGQRGEEAAMQYLRERGYLIHERNWREGHNEIDLVAEHWDTLHFVEVKTRRAGSIQSPAQAMTPAKIRALGQAMRDYLAEHRIRLNVSFDVCTVVAHPDGRMDVELIENAFYL